jgi:UDP-N-acetylmuramyl-tripeptide synthetase
MLLFELIKNADVKVLKGGDKEIRGITIDSRKVKKGDLFVCIKGLSLDSHNYINDAVSNGAAAIVIEDGGLDIENFDTTIALVKDSRAALPILASAFYKSPQDLFDLIGVTGTNGKTSTCFFIEAILAERPKVVGMIGTVDTRVGGKSLDFEFLTSTTPDSVELMQIFDIMSRSCEYVVMEVSSHSLFLRKLEGIKFKVGIFTNLTQDHLDLHGDMENYFNAKSKLFSQSEIAIINIDDPYGARLYETARASAKKIIGAGINSEADFKASDIKYESDGVSYTIRSEKFKNFDGQKLKINIPGGFTVYNTLCAAAAAAALGTPFETVRNALFKIKGVPGRIQKIENNLGFNIFVDYAHSPDGLKNIIKSVREFTKGRVVTIFGAGGERDRKKRPIMGKIASELSDFCVVTSDNPRGEDPEAIIDEIIPGVIGNCEFVRMADRKKAIEFAIQNAKPEDSIIIAGKGHETYQIFANETVHFDDAEVAKNALEGILSK